MNIDFSRYLKALLFVMCLLVAQPAYAGLGAAVTLVTGQPTNIRPGQSTQLEITLSNNNTTASINNVAFANSLPGVLPNGLKISGAATYTCTDPAIPSTTPGAGVLTAVVGTQAISLAGGVIPARANSTDGTCTIIIPVTAGTTTGNATFFNYQISNGAVTGNDGAAVANVGAVNQSINLLASSLPTLSKSFGSSVLTLGGAATTLTIVVNNPNSFTLDNFSVSDTFPLITGNPIIQVANPVVANATCTGGGTPPTFAPVAGATSISATGGTVAANSSCTLTVAVEALDTVGQYQTPIQTNTINGASDFSSDIGYVPVNATAQVRTLSPLGLTKAFANGAISSGSSDTFSIVFSNGGSSPLTINSFTDSPIDGIGNLAFGLKTNGVPSMVCSFGGTPGTFARTANDLGITQTADTTIAAGGTCTLTTNYTATAQTPNVPISYTNTIAEGAVGTTAPGIVSQSVSASVLVSDELRILKTASPSNPAPGNPVRYDVTVQNWSASVINNIDVNDTLTNGQTYLTGVIGANDYTPALSGAGCAGLTTSSILGAASANFSIATLPARTSSFVPGSCTIRFWAMTDPAAANGAAVSNVINGGQVCYNAGATCNGGASDTTSGTISGTILSAVKAFSPAGPLPENTITRMTITLSNISANPLTAVSLSDTLPVAAGGGQLRVASPANAASTCGTPTITATPGSTSVTMNGGTVPARASSGTGSAGTCVLQLDVVGPAGSYNNTAVVAGTQTRANGATVGVGPVNSNTANLVYTSSLSAVKSFSPASVSSGGTSRVTVRVSNSGNVQLTGLAMTDPLPVGMVLANPVNAYSTCDGTVSFTGASGASSISMSGANVAPNGTCDILFDVVATGSASWTNTIPAGNITANGGVANQTPVAAILTFNAPVGLTVAKTTGPSTLTFPGQISLLTITITNGTTPVTDLNLTDYFTADGASASAPNGMRIAASPAASTTCSGGTASATANGTSVSLTGASLGASASCTITVNVTSIVVGGITNFIPIGAITTDQGLTNPGQATTSLTTQGNLGVAKQFTPSIIEPGQRSRLRITFYNPVVQPAVNVGVTDTLPAGLTVPAGANPTTTCTGATITAPAANQVQISGANIPAASGGISETCYSEIDVYAAAGGVFTNTIPIGGLTGTIGGVSATNTQPASAILRALDPLEIHKGIGGNTLDAGDPAGFTTGSATRLTGATAPLVISISNPNASGVSQISLTDALPSGLVVAQVPAASTTCAGGAVNAPASATSISLAGASIGAGASCTVTIQVLSNTAGTYTNTIPAAAISTLEGVTNEEPTEAELIVAAPPTIIKEFSPAVIPANGTSRMTLYLGNDNAAAMTLTSQFNDNLPTAPGSVLVAAVPNVTTDCPGAVTAVAGTGVVSYANGAQIPAGGCSVSVDVTAATPGVHTNNIPAGRLQTNFGNNVSAANATLTVSTQGYISGRVFRDNNVTPNGTYQAGTDTPISGNMVELRSGANCSGALLESTATDAAGNYLFAALAAGTYSVCQTTQPSGTTNGITTAGGLVSANGSTGSAGTASNPTATTSQIINIVLNGDGAGGEVSGSTNNDFAEVVRSSISGRVFLDQNNSGTQNGADTGISGVTVQLLNNLGSVIATQVTDANGDYSFTNLDPGTYSVREPSQPANSSNGITTQGVVGNGGTDGVPTAVAVTPSQISNIVLPPNTAANDNNFAEIPNGRSVTGSVFLDYDNNGTEDGDDYGLSGVVLSLSGTDVNGAPVSATATTQADGSYSFTGLPAGTYTISQAAQPAGTTNGIVTNGTTGGVGSNPTATTSQILNLDLTGTNTLSAANNFAEIPGATPDVTVTKSHNPSSFAAGSSTGTFTISPRNIGAAATVGTITLADTLPAGLTLASVPSGTGWTCSGTVGASSFTCTSTTAIAATSAGNTVSYRVAVSAGATGQLLTNTVIISGGGEPAGFNGNNQALDTVGISTIGRISGTVWRDDDHDRQIDAGEDRVSGWLVELLLGGTVIDTETTNASGVYQFNNVSPASGYQIRFREPTTNLVFGNAVTNEQGLAPVSGTRDTGGSTVNGGTNTGNPGGADTTVFNGTINDITILAGDNIVEQSLPLDPAGIVYDSVTRQPIAGAQVTISGPGGFNPATDLVGGQATVTTGANGFYQFLLTPAAPAGVYTLSITTYPGGYVPVPSTRIPSCTGTILVGAAPDPALIQDDNNAPTLAATVHDPLTCPGTTAALAPGNQASTQYYFSFDIDPALSGDVVNNHIPLDPIGSGAVVVTKTTPIVNTSVAQLVPYTITVQNTTSNALPNIDVKDTIPAGFKYKTGSGSVDGVMTEPSVDGRVLIWAAQALPSNTTRTYKLILIVGSGVQTGEYVNTAQALSMPGSNAISNIATATVRVTPDPVFDCSEIVGKVFDDRNANGYQDEGEGGLANVRLATVNGVLVTTDAGGRFHVACAAVPDAERGSNFLMKLDERTLPSGYRVTTENPRDVRLTRGKMVKLNFGASIHRVVRIDMQASAFIDGTTDLRPEWMAQIDSLPEKIKSQPSVVRLAYTAGGDEPDLARKRLNAVVQLLKQRWEDKACCHDLLIEEELVMPAKASQKLRGQK